MKILKQNESSQKSISSVSLLNPLVWLVVMLFLNISIYGLIFLVPPKALVGTNGWQAVGHFTKNGQFPSNDRDVRLTKARSKELILWGSWDGSDANTGKLLSTPFKAPTAILFYVSGYPALPGQGVYLEDVETDEKYRIGLGIANEVWRSVRINIPQNWQNRLVRLVAHDSGSGFQQWNGISTLYRYDWRMQLACLMVIPIYATTLFLWIVPCLLIAQLFMQTNWCDSRLALLVGIVGACLIGYIVFWVYFFDAGFGKIVSCSLMIGACIACLVSGSRSRLRQLVQLTDIKYPLFLLVFVGLFYTLLLHLFDLPKSISLTPNFRFFPEMLPGDNSLPIRLANMLYLEKPVRPFFFDWLSSDRPPLQAGVLLMQRPISNLWTNPALHWGSFGLILQLIWIPAVWSLGRVLGLDGRRLRIVFGFCIFSGFFFINTTFVWPKLLAAGCAIVTYALLVGLRKASGKETLSYPCLFIAMVAAALAMLAHSGVIFTFLAVAIILCHPRLFPGFKQCAAAMLTAIVVMAPWVCYQKLVDPPGNRLVKWHLAGQTGIDERGVLETIIDQYRALSFRKHLQNRITNLKMLVIPYHKPVFKTLHMNDPTNVQRRQWNSFTHVFFGLGILNLGWVFLISDLLRYRRLSVSMQALALQLRYVIVTVLLALLIWVFLMFIPGSTGIHQGSYATMILLFVGLAAYVSRIYWVAYLALVIDMYYFAVHWIFDIPKDGVFNLLVIPVLICVALVLIFFLIKPSGEKCAQEG